MQLSKITLMLSSAEELCFIGYVDDENVYALDVVSKGQSFAEITGSPASLTPISFEEITDRGFSYEVEPFVGQLPLLHHNREWPTLEEIQQQNVTSTSIEL